MTQTIAPRRRAARLSAAVAAVALGLGLTLSAAQAPAHAQTQSPSQPTAVAATPRVSGEGPALWVVRDADSTVYLFGTVHLLKPGTAWRSDKIDTAFDSASEIWFEVVNPDDQAALAPIFQQYGTAPDRPLSSLLAADDLTRLDAAARATGATAAQLDPLRPWFAALMIGMTPLLQAGYAPQAGVEIDLRDRAQAAGKTIKGFETLDQQVGGLARMSDEGQLTYLRHTLAHYSTAAAEFGHAVEGWRTGDETILKTFSHDTGRGVSEETHQIFLATRNADWVDQIVGVMRGSGTAFVAVGAAHLSGEDSVIEGLRARGLEVTRL